MTPEEHLIFTSAQRFIKNADEDMTRRMCTYLDPMRREFTLRNVYYFISTHMKKDPKFSEIRYNYKTRLRTTCKAMFDCFARGLCCVRVTMNNGQSFQTTPAQLNFLKWFIENRVDDVILENIQEIRLGMVEYGKTKVPRKNKRKGQEEGVEGAAAEGQEVKKAKQV